MIDPAAREALRQELIALLGDDPRVSGVAVTGSAARDAEDEWSDIDLAAGVHDAVHVEPLLERVVTHLRERHGAVDALTLPVGSTVFRVVLLPSGLQVDVSVSPAVDFGPRGPAFRLVRGDAAETAAWPGPGASQVVGTAWLHALHVRSSLARGLVWQARYVLEGMREQVIQLACLRHGLLPVQGRGVDRLPTEVLVGLERTLVADVSHAGLLAGFGTVTEALLVECAHLDPRRAAALSPVLRDLVDQAGAGAGGPDPRG